MRLPSLRPLLLRPLALLLLAVLLLGAGAARAQGGTARRADGREPDFRQARWGDTRDAVGRTEQGAPTAVPPGTVQYTAVVFDRTTVVNYAFAGDALVGAHYLFDPGTHEGAERLLDDVREVLASKYGPETACAATEPFGRSAAGRQCTWEGLPRTRITLSTEHGATAPAVHYVWVSYEAVDPAPLLRAAALREAPLLFGTGRRGGRATTLFGLPWSATEAQLTRTFGPSYDVADDAEAGRLLSFRTPAVGGFEGVVVAQLADGRCHTLYADYAYERIDTAQFSFLEALVTTGLGTPSATEGEGYDYYTQWDADEGSYYLLMNAAPDDEGLYHLTLVAQAAGTAEGDPRRYADDF